MKMRKSRKSLRWILMFSRLCQNLNHRQLRFKAILINNTSALAILKMWFNQDKFSKIIKGQNRKKLIELRKMDRLALIRWIRHWEIGKRKMLMRSRFITLMKSQIMEKKMINHKKLKSKYILMTKPSSDFFRKYKMTNFETMISVSS